MTAIRPAHYILLALFFSVFVFLLHSRAFGGPMYHDSNAILAQMEHVFASGNVLSVIDLFPQRPIPMITFYFNYLIGGMSFWHLFLTQCRMLFSYISVVIFPAPSQVQMLTPQYISISLTEPWTTVPALIGAISLVFTALLLLRKRPLTGFGLFFFILNLVPESFLVPQYVFVSYRVILPMIGLLMVAADAIVFLISRAGYERRIRRGLVSCAVLFIAFFSWVSMSKAALWQDPLIFWKDVVAHFPEDGPHLENRSRVQALNMVGFYLQRKERYAEAIEYHEKALELPNRREASSSFLGKAYLALGRVDDAERMFRLAIQANPTFPEGYLGVAAIMIKKNELAEAYRFTHSAIDIAPNNYGYQNLMGIVLLKQGKLAEAEKHFRMAMAINPQFPDAYYQLGKCALDKDPQNAIKLITHALALDPDHSLANTEIGVILAISGRLAEAESHFRRALKRDPNNELAQENLNIVERQISEMNGR